jgi:primosomal protein N' (replication factor Y)
VNLIELGLWVGHYYACSPWRTFRTLLPRALQRKRTRSTPYLRTTGAERPAKLTQRQMALLDVLAAGALPTKVALERAGVTAATARSLAQRGLLERYTQPEAAPSTFQSPVAEPPASPADAFALTPGQHAALESLTPYLAGERGFGVSLLFGVPGSGKTEVYVRAMRWVIARGRQAILLIPEIALATQIVERLAQRFRRVAVLHSQLTARMRQDTLAAIGAGEVDVVIGTRNAVFAPCPQVGLIVVDEEQESSLKNLAMPYYHARDVAIKRGQIEDVPVLLGSATPSLESWHNAQTRPHYQLLRLPERVPGAVLPEVRLAARSSAADDDGPLLTPLLLRELEQTLSAGEQAILLHNRRGFAVVLRCAECGLVVRCDRCGAHLVFHQSEQQLKCHRCGLRRDVPAGCLDDSCGGRLQQSGAAIQALEAELGRHFPAARCLRLDSDTMRHRDDYQTALRRFEQGEADVMLGTQMVAKGLDFPRVRLVGVIDADAALSLPDFRAAERVFQLIVQVVGRAGRQSGSSLAVVQASAHPAKVIRYALALDYEALARDELSARARLGYPPLTRLARIVLADGRPDRAREAAVALHARLTELAGRVDARLRIEPPQACIIPRLRGLLRQEIMLRGPAGSALQRVLHEAGEARLLRGGVSRLTVDVDPVDLL